MCVRLWFKWTCWADPSGGRSAWSSTASRVEAFLPILHSSTAEARLLLCCPMFRASSLDSFLFSSASFLSGSVSARGMFRRCDRRLESIGSDYDATTARRYGGAEFHQVFQLPEMYHQQIDSTSLIDRRWIVFSRNRTAEEIIQLHLYINRRTIRLSVIASQ